MGKVYGYIRVSKPEQARDGISLQAQERECRQYFERTLSKDGHAWGRLIADEGISAFKIPLEKRAGGRALIRELRHGDHVIVMKLDRAFRSLDDMIMVRRGWRSMGIEIHFLDALFDGDTAMGNAMIQLMGVFAELASRMTSERVKATLLYSRLHGYHEGGRADRWGYKVVRRNGRKAWAPAWDERALMECVVKKYEMGWRNRPALVAYAEQQAAILLGPESKAKRRIWTRSFDRMIRGFWKIVWREGIESTLKWLKDPAMQGLVMLRAQAKFTQYAFGPQPGPGLWTPSAEEESPQAPGDDTAQLPSCEPSPS